MSVRGQARVLSMPSERQALRIGTAGLVAILCSLSLLVALAHRPFQSADENQHVSYALDVSHGLLPTLTTPVTPQIPGMHGGLTYTANHPPLFYLLQAVPLRAGISLGHPLVGFFAGRLLNIGIAILGVLALIWLVRSVSPRQLPMALVAPLIVVLLPLSVAVSGQIYNDAAAIAASTAALACCCRLLLLGVTRSRLLATAGLALLAAALRASGLEIVALAAISAGAAGLLHPAGKNRNRRIRSAAACTGLVAAVSLAGIGWFYLRNQRLYGDLTGARVVVKLFPSPVVPVDRALTSLTFWGNEYRGLFGRLQQLSGWPEIGSVIAGIGFAGALLAALGRLISAARDHRIDRPRRAVAILLGAHIALCLALAVAYVSIGGAPFPRYLLAATPVLAIGITYGLSAIPRRWQSAVIFATGLVMSGVCLTVIARDLGFRNPGLPHSEWGALTTALGRNHVPFPAAALVALLGMLLLGLLAVTAAHFVLSGESAAPSCARHEHPATTGDQARAGARSSAQSGSSSRLNP